MENLEYYSKSNLKFLKFKLLRMNSSLYALGVGGSVDFINRC